MKFMLQFDLRLLLLGPLPGMRLYGCNIPLRAVSDRAPLTVVTSTCQPIEPEAHAHNVQVNRSEPQSLQATGSITQV